MAGVDLGMGKVASQSGSRCSSQSKLCASSFLLPTALESRLGILGIINVK